MIESYAFSSQEMAEKILGANDKNLSYIELLLGSELSLKGNIVTSNTEGSVFIPLFKCKRKVYNKSIILIWKV